MSLKSGTDRTQPAATGHWSLATRLMIWYAGSALLLLAVATGLLYRVVVDTLDYQDKQDLAEEIADVQRILKNRPINLPVLKKKLIDDSSPGSFSPTFLRVLDRDGRQLAETPGMAMLLPISAFPSRPVTSVTEGPVDS